MKLLLLLTLLATLTFCQELTYISPQQHKQSSADQLVETFSNNQGQIYQKVFLHYIQAEITVWRANGFTVQDIQAKIFDLVTNAGGLLANNMKKFMESALFAKLEMQLLTESLRTQIRDHPEDYYLTYEIYDLLVD